MKKMEHTSLDRPGRDLFPPGLSAVIPVFNTARSLAPFVEEVARALEGIGRPFEVILVNDGSEDESWTVVQDLAARHAWIRGFDLMRNYGQHGALLCGIRRARYELIATLDDDGQNPPAEIGRMVEELESGFDVVYGQARLRKQAPWRTLGSWATRRLLHRILGVPDARHAGSFRLFRTYLREAFSDYHGPAVSIDVLLSWATTRFSHVEVENRPRSDGGSNYGLRRLVGHAVDMITGFSTLPLRLASWVGLLLTMFGGCAFGWVLINYFVHGSTVPGFPFLASIIVIFGGGQLFAVGMIGEYLARMHWRSMKRPAFAIRGSTDDTPVSLDSGGG